MESVRILLDGVIDYAGLFPPASLDMQTAVQNYSNYLQNEHGGLLGNFVLPITRLTEFEDAAANLLPKGNPVYPWHLSVIGSDNLIADLEELLDFNVYHARDENAGAVVIDTIELRAETVENIQRAMYILPRTLITYFEIPIQKDPSNLLEAILNFRARAKVRTGGMHPQYFPQAEHLAQFLCLCAKDRVPFKATAGLHHPLRGNYPLSTAPESEATTMYGFLNFLLAASFARFDFDPADVRDVLLEQSPEAIIFDESGIQWRRHRLTNNQLQVTRNQIAMSFGSCSFTDPIKELQALRLL